MLEVSYCTCETYPCLAYGEITSSGTRNPGPLRSIFGGTTWSYQPPQSSQVTKIAVSFHYWLLPVALAVDDTHAGPLSDGKRAWSEFNASGVTNETLRNVPFAMSVRIA